MDVRTSVTGYAEYIGIHARALRRRCAEVVRFDGPRNGVDRPRSERALVEMARDIDTQRRGTQ